ncbi:homocysteine S-methyltransferase 2-like isoform X2 [Xenia sp. Carnegie-2017]|uniref:homocysteine S-methyltransferase 2-like isoform X2 n=1 Tax=Xenia sp. Carnegie-2017 TaxID=2897299 RepID=UPI001F041C3D|nr:homocysteine S-methyltransferase 2-like isoform X2 [Xenia sp. Carnegie-2017]
MQIKICVERKTMENSNLNLAKEFHGGLGSELETLGLNFENDGLWSARAIIEHPDMLKIAHKSFLNSGSNIILTASYQASIEGFIKYANCTSDEARTLMKNVLP